MADFRQYFRPWEDVRPPSSEECVELQLYERQERRFCKGEDILLI
jgi:hypothetical protein